MDAVDAAIRRVTAHTDFQSKFKHPVKFDGSNFVEQKLSSDQQYEEVAKFASGKLHVFLERYGSLLLAEDLRALVRIPAADTAEARFWLEKLLKQPLGQTEVQKRNRRRRWTWVRQEMARAEGYFCEDEMKRRDPHLFHRVVGQHVDTNLRLSAPMEGTLSGVLMQQLERECEAEAAMGAASSRASKKRRCHTSAADGEDSEDDLDDDSDGPLRNESIRMEDVGEGKDAHTADGNAPDDAAVRRAKFLKSMRDRFIDGADLEFNYKALDDDSELDDVVELGRDAEERYFDDE